MTVESSDLFHALDKAEERVRREGDWLVSDLDVLRAVIESSTAVREVLVSAGVDLDSIEERLEGMTSRGGGYSRNGGEALTYEDGIEALLRSMRAQELLQALDDPAVRLVSLVLATPTLDSCIVLNESGVEVAEWERCATASRNGEASDPPSSIDVPGGQQPAPRAVDGHLRIGVRWRAHLQWIRRGFAGYEYILESVSAGAIALFFAPGVLGLAGARFITQDLVGSRIVPEHLHLPLGDDFHLSDESVSPNREFLALLLPSMLLFALGTAFLVPPLLGLSGIGEIPIPLLYKDPALIWTDDGLVLIAAHTMVLAPTTAALGIWCGLSCWYACIPSHGAFARARLGIAAGGHERPMWEMRFRFVVWLLSWPMEKYLGFLAVFDRAMTWLGGGAMVATRGVSLLLLYVAAADAFAILAT